MPPDRPRFGKTGMAKGQKRSGREPKKPKHDQPEAIPSRSPFPVVSSGRPSAPALVYKK
jgi:hypothetical protein